jgi:hypothetical protein
LKDYSAYIFAAYGFAAVVVGFIVAKITVEYRDLTARLARFDRPDKNP